MKKIIFLVVILFVIIFTNSCDPGGKSTTEIINNSSFDLSVSFESNSRGTDDDISILKGKSALLELYSLGGYPSPNYQLDKIIITDINTAEIIKIFETDKDADTDLFELLSVERKKRFWFYQFHASFSLTITDELLQ
ncbi:MAG: hypothetical protein FWD14_02030 [Treponema sp.]|nr:hypothetical protein [Treponema sp.]